MKWKPVIVLLSVLLFFPQTARAQDPLNVLGTGVAVAAVFQSSMQAIDRVVALAFDRLDMTLLTAALEARATLNASRLQFADATTTSVDELDDQQRRILSDVQLLGNGITENVHDVASELVMGTN